MDMLNKLNPSLSSNMSTKQYEISSKWSQNIGANLPMTVMANVAIAG